MNKNLIPALVIIIFLVVAGLAAVYNMTASIGVSEEINSFEECAAAGYPIMESYPEQCRTADGQLFVRDISNDEFYQDFLQGSEQDGETGQ
jgi:hypothetical protein